MVLSMSKAKPGPAHSQTHGVGHGQGPRAKAMPRDKPMTTVMGCSKIKVIGRHGQGRGNGQGQGQE